MINIEDRLLRVSAEARNLIRDSIRSDYVEVDLTKNISSTHVSLSAIFRVLDSFSSIDVLNNALDSKAFKDSLIEEKFSPSIKKALTVLITDTVVGTKPIVKKVSKKIKTGSKPKAHPLRDTKGQFTSVTKLENLMRPMLLDTIIKNMQRPNLRYQTGRFAESVKLNKIVNKDGALNIFLTYMRYPYATFERGGKQGHKGYYPSRLIDQSVREIAVKLTKARFKTTIV